MLNEISIEIIRRCPNNCLHCSSSADKQCQEEMSLEKFKEVVNDAAKLGARTICLSGGEPFLHNAITDMVLFIKQCGLNCYIYTSGIILDANDQPASISSEVLRSISESVTKLIFNIEAGTEKTYDKIMGTKNCYEKMQLSAITAAEIGICTEAHFVPMALNINEIREVITLCEKLHISKLSFLRLVLHGRAAQNRSALELSPEKYDILKEYLYDIQMQSKFSIRIGVPLAKDMSCHGCEAANGKLNIKYDGKVFPCEVFKNYSMETALNGLKPDTIYENSLADIYDGSEYLRLVRNLSKKFSETIKCETCVGQHLMQIDEKAREKNDKSRSKNNISLH